MANESDPKPYRENAVGNSGRWAMDRLAKVPLYKEQIVEMISRGLFLSEIGQALDIHVSTVRRWKTEDREFSEAYADAEAAYMDTVEKEAVRRATEGILEPVVSGGRVVMDPLDPTQPLLVRRYSDPLMMFILRGRRREVYGDKREVEQTTKLDVTGVREELTRRLMGADAGSE